MNKKSIKKAKYLFNKYYKKFTKRELMYIVLSFIFTYSFEKEEQYLKKCLNSVKEE